MIYIIIALVLYVLGLGYACAMDEAGAHRLGWKDADPPRQFLLPFAYPVLAVVGLWFLVLKLWPATTPDWALYLWVMVLRRPYRIETSRVADFAFQLYQRPRRRPRWQRDTLARILRANRHTWRIDPYAFD